MDTICPNCHHSFTAYDSWTKFKSVRMSVRLVKTLNQFFSQKTEAWTNGMLWDIELSSLRDIKGADLRIFRGCGRKTLWELEYILDDAEIPHQLF